MISLIGLVTAWPEPPPPIPVVLVTVVGCSGTASGRDVPAANIPVDAAVTDGQQLVRRRPHRLHRQRPAAGADTTITYLVDSEQDRTSNNPYPAAVICPLQSADGRAD